MFANCYAFCNQIINRFTGLKLKLLFIGGCMMLAVSLPAQSLKIAEIFRMFTKMGSKEFDLTLRQKGWTMDSSISVHNGETDEQLCYWSVMSKSDSDHKELMSLRFTPLNSILMSYEVPGKKEFLVLKAQVRPAGFVRYRDPTDEDFIYEYYYKNPYLLGCNIRRQGKRDVYYIELSNK